MMTDLEIKQGQAASRRIASALREMTPEQRAAVFNDLQREFCVVCGGDASVCRCFQEPEGKS